MVKLWIVLTTIFNPRVADETFTSNLRIMEPSNNPHLLGEELCIARTLVDIEMSNAVLIRVFNLTDEPQIITANTTIAIAKPVQSVQDFDLSGNCNDDKHRLRCPR